MSILLSASPWNNNSGKTKKRVPKLNSKKTIRHQIEEDADTDDNESVDYEGFQNSIDENLLRNDRVNLLLNKVTNAGDGLVDFKPRQGTSLADLLPSKNNSKEGFVSNVKPNSVGDGHISSYDRLYDPSQTQSFTQKPYYAADHQTGGNDKLNYIIRMLEELQMEKTSNITEELLLYSFLGVFMIFIVDSFAKAGKYHR
jgi:hypothetical protein